MRTALILVLLLQDRGLSEDVDRLADEHGLRGARLGVHVWSEKSGEVLATRDDGELYTLASNTKMLTCAAALDRLGPDFKFRTSLEVDGETLLVRGNGDPNLSGRTFDGDPTLLFKRWAKLLREQGARTVRKLVLVNEGFDSETLCPGWAKYETGPWWSAPFGTFSLNDNCVDVKIEPGEEGSPPKITIVPATKYVTITNRMRTVKGSPKPWGFVRRPKSNEIVFNGEIQAGAKPVTAWVSIEDPYRFFGTVLLETLAAEGIDSSAEITVAERAPPGRHVDTYESGLAATLQVCLSVSQNFYAENLLRTLGRQMKGAGTRENGLAVVREFLKDAGITDYEQSDGSGLTPENRMSPRDVVKLLRHMRGHRHAKVFYDALAVNGASTGTLRRRMTAKDLADRVHAKTGHIRGVAALSGYLETQSGDTVVFSILANEWKAGGRPDPFQDRLCEFLIRRKDR